MEKVLIIHEDEACVLWHTVRERLAAGNWSPLDDENWSTLVFLKGLEEKLAKYLDVTPDQPDVISHAELEKIFGAGTWKKG